ncbi:LOW QUALITY PROTEIN: hypothetical protein PV08_00728 [Exophiala spinifera]|uniref:Uncharacterized protein n=1 Tax=Exophiala spinifera TaxID=91928 RepID=A0A0D2BMJ2_9EURO|nr:LOW QUALITY PROTEIN: uncharacterized protein PV08_00728 [Exophiala spinifera]KIW20153.1 LOW QUALITY PROTEIN: hypothetical protein PV08_00728 [Exophiala spinifera]
MPPMRLPVTTLGQTVRTFASHSARRTLAHRLPGLHGPSARILAKTARPHHMPASSFPMVVRDGLSYSALGALTSAGAFLIYCAQYLLVPVFFAPLPIPSRGVDRPK